MAQNKNTSARGIHVSPGIYTREYEISYAAKSLGITTLGLVGETLKGPAFQPMAISDWREFQDVFGGTSTEKFKGSKYPKYELPYVAKSYLSESNQLNVVRVLGLGGYNAGPAWLITASKSDAVGEKKQVVAVLRARGHYLTHRDGSTSTVCDCQLSDYDVLEYNVGELSSTTSNCSRDDYNMSSVTMSSYTDFDDSTDCTSFNMTTGDAVGHGINLTNYGKFSIMGFTKKGSKTTNIDDVDVKDTIFRYAVSLNPNDKDYILKVLGTSPSDGDAPVYVESLYDVALQQAIEEGSVNQIDSELTMINAYYTTDYCRLNAIDGMLETPHASLSRKFVGMRFLATKQSKENGYKYCPYDYATNMPISSVTTGETIIDENLTTVELGQIYTVKQFTDKSGKRHYFYTRYKENLPTYDAIDDNVINAYDNLKGSESTFDVSGGTSGNGNKANQKASIVYSKADGMYYLVNASDIKYVELDINDYHSAFRYASTPWIVSNLKGDSTKAEVNKMFRFHTISDGDSANYMVKVSIENIMPDSGLFDVIVRDINDVDESIVPLEKFQKCSMIPGDANYVAYKIGSFDGVYESKSKYITIEMAETSTSKNSVPCGFMGYPIPQYGGIQINGSKSTNSVKFPNIKYNLDFDEDIKNRKQYFGLSSIVGVDIDLFTFKGTKTYVDDPKFVSKGFHLDCRVDALLDGDKDTTKVTVDGVSGYQFDSVSEQSRTSLLSNPPIIGTEYEMEGSIYQYANLRKFTVYFYGGFDGWDIYRDERTNGDEFKVTKYRGYINKNSGEGYSFNRIQNPGELGLNQKAITSDWYAYLSGIRQFANPESVDINVFATPGIDYVNQKLLVQEAIDMIEEERADSIYVITTPDKPKGADDYPTEMYTPDEAVYNLEDSEIDSNYSCTYYPWVKYLDQDNSQYIYLPPTKDVVRNFALTDNTAYPWFAPAGVDRGSVDCVRAKFITKLADEDVLYEGRINPVKTFSSEGPRIWGQKNLQIEEGQLNRIAVRRLLLRIRKLISIACIGLIFDQYDSTVKQSFISAVTPILENIRNNRGISDYRIEVDDSIEARQNRELLAKLYFKPYDALEYVSIDLVLTPQSVSFEDI